MTRRAPAPRYRVFAYRQTENLGDAIQTYALCRLLGGRCRGVYRDEPFPESAQELPLIVNGWLGDQIPSDAPPAIFAGIHIDQAEDVLVPWVRRSRSLAGTRDPYTQDLLTGCGIPAELIGCVTLTLPRYEGPRRGRYTIDVAPRPDAIRLTNLLGDLPWAAQWTLAIERLKLLRTAELIYTNRLHIALPCLAFGTPVVWPLTELRIAQKHRLGLLGLLGFRYDEPVTLDVEPWACRYRRFLARALDPPPAPVRHVRFPRAIPPHPLDREAIAPRRRRVRRAPRIFYFCAGDRRHGSREHESYRHVDLLSRGGFDAYVTSPLEATPGEAPRVPFMSLAALAEHYDPALDIVVFPGALAQKYVPITGGRKVLWLRQPTVMLKAIDHGHRPAEHGVIGVLANGPALTRSLEFAGVDVPVFLVRDTADPAWVPFRGWDEKAPLIAIASSAPDDSVPVLRMLRLRGRRGANRLAAFRIADLGTATRAQAAEWLAHAALVLAVDPDSDPAAQEEALAAGCVVLAAKHGEEEPSIPGLSRCARGDLLGMVAAIEQVMDEFLDRRLAGPTMASDEARRAYAATLRSQPERDRDVVAAWEALVQPVDGR